MDELKIEETYIELRKFLEERQINTEERWRIINQHKLKDEQGNIDEVKLLEIWQQENQNIPIAKLLSVEAFKHDFKMLRDKYIQLDKDNDEDFEFYRPLKQSDHNPDRMPPAEGLNFVNLRYHNDNPVVADPDRPQEGFPVDPSIMNIIRQFHPEYESIIDQYQRPLGTTDATFKDFNKPQVESDPIPEDVKERILLHTYRKLGVKPYKPIHYEAVAFAKMPLSTGTGYFDRHHYTTRAYAKMTRSDIYKTKPRSKGFFYNATYNIHRTVIHNIKHYKSPKAPGKVNIYSIYNRNSIMRKFIARHTTMLFTRNHISKKPKQKTRPVYNVDPMFLKIEAMLTHSLLVQTRPVSSCLMYSLETIRGGCHYLDKVAKLFSSYLSLDWSSYDQTLSRQLTDLYYTEFLENLIVIDQGYTSTITYPQHKPQPPETLFKKMSNLLEFLHEWYNSMAYTTADGYTYQRTCAGVPSGLYNTQMVDSVCNIFIIIEALIAYGMTDKQIDEIRLFIMGDDNVAFTHMNLSQLDKFVRFFTVHAKQRWNMTIQPDKSKITNKRNEVEILSYTINFGYARRSIDKLVAQLCYPERGLDPRFMSYRAIGIAFAAAGQDAEFHAFCERIYILFFRERKQLDEPVMIKLRKLLPGIFRAVQDEITDFTLDTFPTIYEVQEVYREWQGPLAYEPKWDESYFIEPPYITNDNYMTIAQYRKLHNIPREYPVFHDLNDLAKELK